MDASVATRPVVADGNPRDLRVTLPVSRSGWIAARILPSSHTNPVFVTVEQQPMKPSKTSAQWALEAVEKCWRQKMGNIRESERAAASAAYDHARAVYRKLLERGHRRLRRDGTEHNHDGAMARWRDGETSRWRETIWFQFRH